MTSTLILFFIYLGIIALWRAFDDQLRAARIVAVVTLVGALDIPVIKFSVDWWNTLHQPASILTADRPADAGLDPDAAASSCCWPSRCCSCCCSSSPCAPKS